MIGLMTLAARLSKNSKDEASAGNALVKLRNLISSGDDANDAKVMYLFANQISTYVIGAFGVWDLANSNGILSNDGVSRSEGYGLEKRLIVDMLEDDPGRAMLLLSKEKQTNFFSLAMTKYVEKNEKDALLWMEKNNSNLSQDMRDEGNSALAKQLVSSGDVDSAIEFSKKYVMIS